MSSWPAELQLYTVPSPILKCTFSHYPRGLPSIGDPTAASNNPAPPVCTSNNLKNFMSDSIHRMVRSRTPTFPIFINDECFICVQTYMTSIKYKGPVALGCDDTKLHPSLQVYWDNSISEHILVGTTLQAKVVVANPEELWTLLTQYTNRVATKVGGTPACVSSA